MIIKCQDIDNRIIYFNSDNILYILFSEDYYVFRTFTQSFRIKKVLGTYDNFKNFLQGAF